MSDYEKIRRMFVYGVSAMAYCRVVVPEVQELHRSARHFDAIATLMLKRGDLIPPRILRPVRSKFVDSNFDSCFR